MIERMWTVWDSVVSTVPVSSRAILQAHSPVGATAMQFVATRSGMEMELIRRETDFIRAVPPHAQAEVRESDIHGLHGQRVVLVPQDSGTPRSWDYGPEEFNLGAENPGSHLSEAQRGLNVDQTQASTERHAADEAFPTVVDGSDTDSGR